MGEETVARNNQVGKLLKMYRDLTNVNHNAEHSIHLAGVLRKRAAVNFLQTLQLTRNSSTTATAMRNHEFLPHPLFRTFLGKATSRKSQVSKV